MGPAFFTKFLYFADAPDAGRALILDAVIARALNHLVPDLRFPAAGWRTPRYAYYLGFMTHLAADRGVPRGVAESVLFKFGRGLG